MICSTSPISAFDPISQVIRSGPGKVESIEPAEVEEKPNEMIVETLSSLVPPTSYISLKFE
jgi:hypothetical protein